MKYNKKRNLQIYNIFFLLSFPWDNNNNCYLNKNIRGVKVLLNTLTTKKELNLIKILKSILISISIFSIIQDFILYYILEIKYILFIIIFNNICTWHVFAFFFFFTNILTSNNIFIFYIYKRKTIKKNHLFNKIIYILPNSKVT